MARYRARLHQWPILSAMALAATLLGCGGDQQTAEGTEDGTAGDTGGEDPYGPDYGGCGVLDDPTCSGVECAQDPEAEYWLQLVEAEIAERGWSDRVFVVSASSQGDATVAFQIMAEVGWYRTWARLPAFGGLPTDGSELAFTVPVSNFFDELQLPDSVIDFELVEEAFADCDARLTYDACDSNGWNFDIYENVVYFPEPNCQEDDVTLRIDVVTGEITCDPDPPEVGCE